MPESSGDVGSEVSRSDGAMFFSVTAMDSGLRVPDGGLFCHESVPVRDGTTAALAVGFLGSSSWIAAGDPVRRCSDSSSGD